ncbi:MAG: hypothetical protein ABSC89_02000 [Verrucomicrobiota bacterium]|jgi:hypothetical protein
MSRPQKIIPPIKGEFNNILRSVAMGSGVGKRAAIKLARGKAAGKNIVKATDQTPPREP